MTFGMRLNLRALPVVLAAPYCGSCAPIRSRNSVASPSTRRVFSRWLCPAMIRRRLLGSFQALASSLINAALALPPSGGLADPHLEHNPAVGQFAQTFDGGAAGSGLQPHGDFQPLSGVP